MSTIAVIFYVKKAFGKVWFFGLQTNLIDFSFEFNYASSIASYLSNNMRSAYVIFTAPSLVAHSYGVS
jgi:hypothetical protein